MTSNKDIINLLKQLKESTRPDQASIERNKAKLLTYYKEKFPCVRKDVFFYFRPALVSILALFVFIAGSGSLVAYAEKASPGDLLYSLKRIRENVVYQLTPKDQRPVLRAEMVERRINEVRTLVEKSEWNDFVNLKTQDSIKRATQELEKEIIALKKEITPVSQVVVSSPAGDLAVRDNRRIVTTLRDREVDINEMIAKTKEAIKENDLVAALNKIGEVEKIILVEIDENDEDEEMEIVITEEPVSDEIDETEKQEEKILPLIEKKPADFKVEIKKESAEIFQADLIKEE